MIGNTVSSMASRLYFSSWWQTWLNNFSTDDLPVIRQNIQKGFQETRTTINKWVSEFKKRLDGDDSDEELAGHPSGSQYQRQDYGPSQSAQLAGIRRSAERARRSGDQLRYDADPHVIGDDFRHLDLRDNEEEGKYNLLSFHLL